MTIGRRACILAAAILVCNPSRGLSGLEITVEGRHSCGNTKLIISTRSERSYKRVRFPEKKHF